MVFYDKILCDWVYIGCFPKTSEINFKMETNGVEMSLENS